MNLPTFCKFDDNSFLSDTDYWQLDMCENGFYYCVFNMDKYFLLIPKDRNNLEDEIASTESVIITRGNFKGKDNWFELMFEDNTDTPYSIMLENEQLNRVSAQKKGWNGHFYIFSGSLKNCIRKFDKVYYRETNTLPCLNPVE